LVGGSTDLQQYLDKYETGSVVSFASSLYTYIILNPIRYGTTHNIVYGDVKEKVDYRTPELIKNDVARVVFTHFKPPPIEITFTADIPSSGSGLAASSSYIVALIEAVTKSLGIKMSQCEICKLAVDLERIFNPMTGYQDAYGCGLGALKQLKFNRQGLESVKFLDTGAFRKMSMYLYPTHQTRSSTAVLKTLNLEEVHKMSSFGNSMAEHIQSDYFISQLLKLAWNIKKNTSPEIMTPELKSIEEMLWAKDVKSLKLLGAGGGGYFLVLTEHPKNYDEWRPIEIDYTGVTSIQV